MEINKKISQRQIPTAKEYVSSKMYTDLLYGYLQTICEITPEKRKIIYKQEIKFTTIGEIIGVTRQTASKKFKGLIDLGLVIEHENHYELITLDNNIAFLLPYPTLRALVYTLQERTISVYVYLLNRYIANGEQPFIFTMEQLKEILGLSTKNNHSNDLVGDVLTILKELGLINYTLKTGKNQHGQIVSNYTLTFATNTLGQSVKKTHGEC